MKKAILMIVIGIVTLSAMSYFLFTKNRGEAVSYRLPILIYHHLSYDESLWGSATMSPDLFERHMLALQENGYNAISYKQLLGFIDNGVELPVNPILITFDDGYRSNYEYAYPILTELGMKASIAVIGWSVGETKYKDGSFDIIPHFTWAEAKEMVDSGLIEIEAHTYDMHEYGQWLSKRIGVAQMEDESEDEYRQALQQDFSKIYELIETNTGVAPLCMTYPYGLSSSISEDIVSLTGYTFSVVTERGMNIITRDSTMKKLKRYNMGADCSEQQLLAMLKQGLEEQ